MEAHVVVAEAGMDKTGDDMLAGMLLHPGKAFFPVQDAFYLCADFQGLGPGFYRVCVRSRGENKRLIQAIQQEREAFHG